MTTLTDVAVQHYQPRMSRDQLPNLLRAAYQQLLERQPYDRERQGEFAHMEQDFLRGKVGIKRLVRQIGHSHLYQHLFFDGGCNTRCVEQGFKHFLGRSPSHRGEVAHYHNVLVHQGFKAMVDAFLDSEDYRIAFGADTLPHQRQQFAHQPPITYLMTQRIHASHQLPMVQPPILQSLSVL
jgi:hypothetical protein